MSNNIIVINRGDTYEFDLTIEDIADTDGVYNLIEDDAVYLGIMDPNQPFEDALVKKKFTEEDMDENGIISITINPDDTLDLFPGKYYYAIKLHMSHEDEYGDLVDKVFTVINKTKFIICD